MSMATTAVRAGSRSTMARIVVERSVTVKPRRGVPGGRPAGPLGSLREVRDLLRVTHQLEDVHAGVGAIDDDDVAAVVDVDVVGLDGDLARLHAVGGHASLVGVRRGG